MMLSTLPKKSHAVNRRGFSETISTIQGQLLLVELLGKSGGAERGILRGPLCSCAQLGGEVAVVAEVVAATPASEVQRPTIVKQQPAGFRLGYPIDLATGVRLILGIEGVVSQLN